MNAVDFGIIEHDPVLLIKAAKAMLDAVHGGRAIGLEGVEKLLDDGVDAGAEAAARDDGGAHAGREDDVLAGAGAHEGGERGALREDDVAQDLRVVVDEGGGRATGEQRGRVGAHIVQIGETRRGVELRAREMRARLGGRGVRRRLGGADREDFGWGVGWRALPGLRNWGWGEEGEHGWGGAGVEGVCRKVGDQVGDERCGTCIFHWRYVRVSL